MRFPLRRARGRILHNALSQLARASPVVYAPRSLSLNLHLCSKLFALLYQRLTRQLVSHPARINNSTLFLKTGHGEGLQAW